MKYTQLRKEDIEQLYSWRKRWDRAKDEDSLLTKIKQQTFCHTPCVSLSLPVKDKQTTNTDA